MGIYERLGVRTLINARGTATALGGTLMPPEVLRAMYEASQAFVDLSELLQKAGERIADLIGVEAAHVSSGAAGGMTLAAAACILNGNRNRINDLPNTTVRLRLTVIQVAKSANVPVIVDAASELPPATNLTKYWRMGADLSVFSGGKGLMGPQCTGLILGRKDLIDMFARLTDAYSPLSQRG